MKLITYSHNGFSRIAELKTETNQVIDLNYAYQAQLKSEGKYRYEEIAHAFVPATARSEIIPRW